MASIWGAQIFIGCLMEGLRAPLGGRCSDPEHTRDFVNFGIILYRTITQFRDLAASEARARLLFTSGEDKLTFGNAQWNGVNDAPLY